MPSPELPRIQPIPPDLPAPTPSPAGPAREVEAQAAGPIDPWVTEFSSHPRFEGYVTLDPIAQGGYGSVYRILRRGEGHFAAKVLREDLFLADPDKDKLIAYEADLMGWVRHHNVMPIEERGRLPDGRTYFVMPLCSEGAFSDACYPRLTDDELIAGFDRGIDVQAVFPRRLIQAADGLANLHAHRVIHRDVSPGNILRLLGRGIVSDLGNSIFVDHQYAERPFDAKHLPWQPPFDRTHKSNPETVIGNMKFMSPEQMRAKWLEPRSDVFSLAVMIHVFAHGTHPFEDGPVDWDERRVSQDLRLMHATGRGRRVGIGRPSHAQALPLQLVGLIDGGLALNPADRPTAREVATALRETCDVLGITEHVNPFESEAVERRILSE